MKKKNFLNILYSFYDNHKRILPFRETIDPYWVFITEIMLQQTQVKTVLNKFDFFINSFPDFNSLATAAFQDILPIWKGLGYNRRALYLKQSAEKLITQYNQIIPKDPKILETFPGIGKNTAASIIIYTYNIPLLFIETNIRTVFIYHFFNEENDKVTDKQIMPLLEQYLDTEDPRKFYYALMDYGSYLKKEIKNINYKSKHYIKQNKFEGSNREIRSKILHLLLEHKELSEEDINKYISDNRLEKNLKNLEKETLIKKENNIYCLN